MATDSPDILFILGTRPEIIKLAPVIRTVEDSDRLSMRLVHTGQHYDDELSRVFFENLKLSPPDEWLGVGSGTQAEQTASALRGIEHVLDSTDPSAVAALGDTNAVLSTAIVASKMSPLFAHVEAGIRSFDRSMPEEINRVLADRVADIAFAPTETAVQNLADEGITDSVQLVGNTIVDACLEHRSIAVERSNVLSRLGIEGTEYVVATIHRPRNTDDEQRLQTIVEGLDDQSVPVVFPTHPRTERILNEMKFTSNGSLRLIDPLDYLDFLALLENAVATVTDSGGVQEEASILEVPCLTVRPNTERPETVEAGVNRLVDPVNVKAAVVELLSSRTCRREMTGAPGLYGDGNAAERIISTLETAVGPSE